MRVLAALFALLWAVPSFAAGQLPNPQLRLGTSENSVVVAKNNADLTALASTAASYVVRKSGTKPGDSTDITFLPSTAACTLNSGLGDGLTQVPSSDGKCWVATAAKPIYASVPDTVSGYFTVTTTAGTNAVTFGGATFTSADVGKDMWCLGFGPLEQDAYAGTITAYSSSTSVSITPAPTLSWTAVSVLCHYGTDQSTNLQAAFTAGTTLGVGSYVPAGVYLVNTPLVCLPGRLYNNLRAPPQLCDFNQGTLVVAVAPMTNVMTYGALNTDYTGYLQGATIQGGVISGGFNATNCIYVPFFNILTRTHQGTKDCTHGVQYGDTAAPGASGGANDIFNFGSRDITTIPVSGITNANPATVTTTYPHGFATGRVVYIGSGSTVTAGGAGYGISATGTLTWGGTGCSTNPIASVSTNASGVIVTASVNSGSCSTWPSSTSTGWGTPTGGLSAGTGVEINIGTFETNFQEGYQVTVTSATTFTLNNANSTAWPAFASASVSQTMPSNSLEYQISAVSTGTTTTITVPSGAVANNEKVFIADLNMWNLSWAGNCIDGVYTATYISATQFTIPVNSSSCYTYTANTGWVIPAPNWTGSTNANPIAESFVYNAWATDQQMYGDEFYGVRVGVINNPATSGYDGKIAFHDYNYVENGELLTSYYGGGDNNFIGLQTDCPARYAVWLTGPRNTLSSSEADCHGFLFLPNNEFSFVRLDSGGAATVNGGSIKGQSGGAILQALSSPNAAAGQVNNITGVYAQFGLSQVYVSYTQNDGGNNGGFQETNSAGNSGIFAISGHAGSQGQMGVCDSNSNTLGLYWASGVTPAIALNYYYQGACVYDKTVLLFSPNVVTSALPLLPAGPYQASGGTALPACGTTYKGAFTWVNDATSATGTYTGGGSNITWEFCNGSSWVH